MARDRWTLLLEGDPKTGRAVVFMGRPGVGKARSVQDLGQYGSTGEAVQAAYDDCVKQLDARQSAAQLA